MTNIALAASIPVFATLFLFLLSFTALTLYTVTRRSDTVSSHQPPVSVLIPAYNEAQSIEACLTSFQENDYPEQNLQVFVVDDGSTDNTRQIVDNHAYGDLITQDHKGKVAALNKAYDKATHDILVVADADTTVDEDFLKRVTAPFQNADVGAVSGAVTPKQNKTGFLHWFQTVEYYYNNLIRNGISTVFTTDIWFFGCIAAYRRSALKDINGFPAESLTEDMDIVMRMRRHDWKTVHAPFANGQTQTPKTVIELAKQRRRWWGGGYQLLNKHDDLFGEDSTFTFIAFHHWWWAVYALLSVPLLTYQFIYWLPGSLETIVMYTVRWLSLLGPVAVLYKIPNGWLSWYNVFGVLSGLFTAGLILTGLWYYEKRVGVGDIVALFLYFPYTIVLNTFILLGVWEASQNPNKDYIE
jgi:cellulose synthase/poly-beta-1,6-N-acetylglucosamine synthase-like glycosyltransferase